jgi:uncharacterized RDD family membrane protein YckC
MTIIAHARAPRGTTLYDVAQYPGEQVTYTRRFFGDSWLESVLQILTLGIGWLIWFAIVAPEGKTPAKQLLKVYIYDAKTGRIASTGQVWLRDFVGKVLIPLVIVIAWALATGSLSGREPSGFYTLVGAVIIFFNPLRRALWDFLAGTVVRYVPEQPRTLPEMSTVERSLQELENLRIRGSISDAEYEEKRKEIIARL